MLETIASTLDKVTGVQGSLGYVVIVILAIALRAFMDAWMKGKRISKGSKSNDETEDDGPEPARNYTEAQLLKFNGSIDKTGRFEVTQQVYLSLNGTVFDVTEGKNFYGPGGPYELFAGHECGVAFAKMSFDNDHLDDMDGCEKLTNSEKHELIGWMEKFTYYRAYPVKGSLIPNNKLSPSDRILSKEEIAKHDGNGTVPEGYAVAPIYIGVGERVFDVSFGGVEFYGKGGAYERFAGKDASRALAKMSFDPADTANTDTSDLSEKELKVLNDWVKTFDERKGYPVVGKIAK
uniref:Cytochrome b5 heme-binding domain-containing protein n=1 Tax=Proboscia inermis TaxID=420281 RepID=A0A7S0CLZ8_9STRA|mmetsp:Transcript_9204/g.9309  ORF Transcript_9204/g.9309 Transcript_9204/m.9309 type:complete len:292 (+) Transcript_9204:102-977(+)